jgi:hypothetical protein
MAPMFLVDIQGDVLCMHALKRSRRVKNLNVDKGSGFHRRAGSA